MNDDERNELADFVLSVRDLLKRAVFEHPEWIAPELRPQMESAWNELQPFFRQAVDDIQSRRFDRELEREGLTGDQLRFKVAGFSMANEDFSKETHRAQRGRLRAFPGRLFSARGRLL